MNRTDLADTSGLAKAPSGPRSLPAIGSIPWMIQDPLGFLRRAARDHGSVVDLGALGRRRSYLVAHPDAVKHVLQENSRNYTKGATFEAIRAITGDGVVSSEGEHWRKQRRMLQPAFHKHKVLSITEAIVNVTLASCAPWNEAPPGEALDVRAEMTKLTQRVLFKALLGVDQGDQAAELSRAWDIALEGLTARLMVPFKLPFDLPLPANTRYKRALATLDEAAYSIIRGRRASTEDPHDMLSLLLAARDDETGAGMTDKELRDQIMTFFIGGFETAATALSWTIHLLSQHPDIERKVLAELSHVLAGRMPTADDIGRLPYMRMVIDESLRLYPGAWLFTRSNTEADEVCGFALEPGSIVFVSPYVTQRLPEFWENPDAFDPERFSPENAKSRPRFAYFPFGGGTRQCIGDVFAITEIIIVLAVVLQRYRMLPVPGFTVEPKAMASLRPKRGPLMFVTRRTIARAAG